MALLRWEYKVSMILIMFGMAAGLLILTEWLYGLNQRENLMTEINRKQSADYQVEPLPEYTFLQNPVEHYTETVSRPLFVEGRRPIEEAEEEEMPTEIGPSKPFDLVLIGSLNTPLDGVVAMFKNPAAQQPGDIYLRYAIGEDHEGWVIKAIEADKIIIEANGKEEEILLLKASPKAPKKKPVKRKPTARKPATTRSNQPRKSTQKKTQ